MHFSPWIQLGLPLWWYYGLQKAQVWSKIYLGLWVSGKACLSAQQQRHARKLARDWWTQCFFCRLVWFPNQSVMHSMAAVHLTTWRHLCTWSTRCDLPEGDSFCTLIGSVWDFYNCSKSGQLTLHKSPSGSWALSCVPVKRRTLNWGGYKLTQLWQ